MSTNAAGSIRRVRRQPDPTPTRLTKNLAGAVVLVAATLLAYWPAVHGAFLFDDDAMVTGSMLVKASDGLRRMWLTTEAIDYWPLTNSTLWVEWRLWGENPTGYHVTNILLHACSGLIVWAILRKLSIRGAWIAAMLFALHPVNVQSVAWIAQRKNTLSMTFFLLAILWFIRALARDAEHFSGVWRPASAGRDAGPPEGGHRTRMKKSAPEVRGTQREARGRSIWYWLSLAAFALAMLSKGSVAVLPGVLLLLIWWTKGSVTREDLVKVAPFLIIAVALTVVNVWFQRRMEGGERDVTLLERMLGAGGVIWFYLAKAILPIRQAFIYPQWNVSAGNPLWWLPAAAAVAATVGLFRQRRRPAARALLFAWLLFCVALVPVMGFTDVYFMTYSLVADHYQYIAMIAVVAGIGAALGHVERRTSNVKRAVRAAASVLIVAFGLMTWKQAGLYANGETLYRASLEVNPDAWVLRNNLGALLLERNDDEEALQQLREALRANPDFRQVHNNLCTALVRRQLMDEAIFECSTALQMTPGRAASHYSLGVALAARGHIERALVEFQTALRLYPDSIQTRSYLGELFLETGSPAAAAEQFREVIRRRSDAPLAHAGLGRALGRLGDAAGAEAALREAIRLDPSLAEPHRGLADLLLETGRLDEAVAEYRQALSRDPQSPEAHNNLGVALSRAGRSAEATEEFRAALALDPSFAPARDNLDRISGR